MEQLLFPSMVTTPAAASWQESMVGEALSKNSAKDSIESVGERQSLRTLREVLSGADEPLGGSLEGSQSPKYSLVFCRAGLEG